MTQINSIEELIKTIEEGNNDFFISLGSILRSSKYITYNDGIFHILHEIDGYEEELTTEQLFDEDYTNIGSMIKNGNFYQY